MILKSSLILGASLCLALLGTENGMSSETDRPIEYYFLSVRTDHALARVELNGVTLTQDEEDGSLVSTEQVNAWLMPGKNRLTVTLKPVADALESETPAVEIKLYLHDASEEYPTPKTLLAHYRYPAQAQQKAPPLPVTESIDFVFSGQMATKLWQQAQVLEEGQGDGRGWHCCDDREDVGRRVQDAGDGAEAPDGQGSA